MMTAKPTGHYALKSDGLYLQFDRLFYAPIEDVWYSLTNPTAMQAWIGTYTGSPATGGVRFKMTFEEGDEWQNVSILECQPPHRFLADSVPQLEYERSRVMTSAAEQAGRRWRRTRAGIEERNG